MPIVDLIYFDAGGGHRSAAQSLELVIRERHPEWETRLVNLQEVLDPLDVLRKHTGLRIEDGYNLMLKRDWTIVAAPLLPVLHAVIRLYHRDQVRVIEAHWRKTRPGLVVSVVPNFNRAMLEALRRVSTTVPMVTVLTDLADYPPHMWMEPQEQYWICGSERAVEQARALGIAERWIRRTSGMIVHPRFYQPFTVDRGAERKKLGLDPNLPTAVVMFGGQGSKAMLGIARRLDESKIEVQLILICGHNQKLEVRLKKLPSRLPRAVIGYSKEVPYFMHLSDFFIGKPGPGSISEATVMQLPAIVERNISTMPQERYNVEWLLQKQVGLAVRNFRSIDEAVAQLLDPEKLARYRANAAALNNQAVFEVVDILQEICTL